MSSFAKWFASVAIVSALSGCLATTGSVREIETAPSGALITIENFGECMSPCSIKLDGPRKIKVAKAGYLPVSMTINPGRGRINIPLTLAAPTDDVDAETLPEL